MGNDRFRDRAEILKALAENRRVREETWGELIGEREALKALLIRGRAAGLSVTEMARSAGVSRSTAHKSLRGRR